VALLVGATLEGNLDALELLDELRLFLALLGFLPLDFLAAGFDLLDVVGRRLDGEILGEEVIACVAG
jgi:hypothetical protein